MPTGRRHRYESGRDRRSSHLPMAVDLPVRARELVPVRGTPIPNRLVRRAELVIRPEVNHRHGKARWSSRPNDVASVRKRPIQLDADFEANRAVPIHCHVPAGPELVGADKRPNHTAPLWNGNRELRGTRLTTHDRERNTADVRDLDFSERHAVPRTPTSREAPRLRES